MGVEVCNNPCYNFGAPCAENWDRVCCGNDGCLVCSFECSYCCGFICCGWLCEATAASTFAILIGSIIFTLVTVFILGVLQAFDPKGPFFLVMFVGSILAVGFTGIRFNTGTCNYEGVKEKVCHSMKTTRGRFTFIHSHHPPYLREAGHEFKIGHKYFCTGCYGTLIGLIIMLLLMSAYVLFGLTADLAFLVSLAIPICFIPIALRYTVFKQMRTLLRLVSNILLPIGAGLLLVFCDFIFHSWIVNVSLVLFLLLICFLRVFASAKENNAPNKLSPIS